MHNQQNITQIYTIHEMYKAQNDCDKTIHYNCNGVVLPKKIKKGVELTDLVDLIIWKVEQKLKSVSYS